MNNLICLFLSFFPFFQLYSCFLQDQQRFKLPSSVFQSEVEEDVGLLNRAAPHSGKVYFCTSIHFN